MSCILSHPISGQILVLESGRPALLYTALNNLNIDLSTGSRIVLKSYTNLFCLESTEESKNIYPTSIGFVQGSGLPNGLVLHNYNTITGRLNTTGRWNVATNYLYPNNPQPVTKIFQILVKPTGGSINTYALPTFETVFNNNGQPLFPISGNQGIQIPIEENGQILFVPSGEVREASPFTESEGPTIEEGEVEQEDPPPPPPPGGGGGDPINTMPLRIFSNAETNNNGVITGFAHPNCTWVSSRYIDTRTRVENLFLGRIGNRYVRIDTQTTNGWTPGVLGIIVGIKYSQGILAPSGQNGYYPFGIETGSTAYFIHSGWVGNDVATSLIRKDLNGPYIDIIQNGTGINLGNTLPSPRLLADGATNFDITTDVGIDNVTALRSRWRVNIIRWRGANQAALGGFVSYFLGDLHSFDQLGGSLIEQLNYTYGLAPYTHETPIGLQPTVFRDVVNIQTGDWPNWGRTLKWVELTPKTKHFYGINWLMSRAWRGSGISGLNNSPIMSGLQWRRSDSGIFSGSAILISSGLRAPNLCWPPNVILDLCPDCDPACDNFNGDFAAANSSPMGCAGGSPMSQHLANCYGLPWSSTPCPSSSSSGPGGNNFIDFVEFENLIN